MTNVTNDLAPPTTDLPVPLVRRDTVWTIHVDTVPSSKLVSVAETLRGERDVHATRDVATNESDPESTIQRSYEPLAPWEQVSIHNRTCQPPVPNGATVPFPIPDYCCVGSNPYKGRLRYDSPGCDKGRDVYERTEQVALASLTPLATSSMPCDVCRIMDILLDHNWTMAFMGDSLMGQSFFGLECELRRRLVYRIEPVAVESFRVEGPWEQSRYGLSAIHELRVSRLDDDTATTTTIRFYAMYRPNWDAIVDRIMPQTDVLMFDHGVHYLMSDLVDYETDMTRLLNLTRHTRATSWKLLAWRETPAQHFDTPGGEFHGRHRHCGPLNQNYPDATRDERLRPRRRRTILERVLASWKDRTNQTTHVALLDFWNYTSQFHDLHPPGDCTHYCSTPSFWLFQWRQLRLALDAVVPQPP